MKRNTRQYLQDIVDHAEEALALSPATLEEFQQSRIDQYALIWLIQVIGEACTKIPASLRDEYSDIPWRPIIGMRHRIVHGYFDVDLDVVWKVVIRRLPALVPQIKAILATLPDDQ